MRWVDREGKSTTSTKTTKIVHYNN